MTQAELREAGMASEEVADPFASDLFSEPHRHDDDGQSLDARTGPSAAGSPAAAWYSRLPRVSRREAHLSAVVTSLSPEFYARVSESVRKCVAAYTRVPLEEVCLELGDLREADMETSALLVGRRQRSFASFSAQPGAVSRIAVELSAYFAATVIDRVLGGDGLPPDRLRDLSNAEGAVMEFIYLNVVREVNAQLGEAAVTLDGVTAEPPLWLAAIGAAAGDGAGADKGRALIATFRVSVKNAFGYARVYASVESFESLAGALRRRVHQIGGGEALRQSALAEMVRRYSRLAPEVALSLAVGEVELTLDDLLRLEPGDVLLLERVFIRPDAAGAAADWRVRIGEGDGLTIVGTRQAPAGGHAPAAPVVLRVGAIMEKDKRADAGQLGPTAAADEKQFAETAAALGGLVLTVHVEIAARRARLDELAELRVGQLIDLGCSVTEPVDLVVDGRRIARGELIDIEGRLGVRLTQVAGQ